ncbi:MAG TPA: DUF6118 family protein [Rhizomicrobium sp.]|jgi:hypothetical protein
MSERHGSGDPAQAFEDLRAEVSVLRKAIEVLPDALERNRAPDYSPDFAVIGQGMDAIGAALENLQKHPALRLTPEQHGSAVAQAGSALIRDAVQRFDLATQEAERERYNLAKAIGVARSKSDQRKWLAIVAAIGLTVGFGMFPFVIRAMPFGMDSATAAMLMRGSKWDAGMALMKAGNPDGWAQLTEDANLVSANRSKITDCRATAAKEKREQRCPVIIPAP